MEARCQQKVTGRAYNRTRTNEKNKLPLSVLEVRCRGATYGTAVAGLIRCNWEVPPGRDNRGIDGTVTRFRSMSSKKKKNSKIGFSASFGVRNHEHVMAGYLLDNLVAARGLCPLMRFFEANHIKGA